MSTPPNDPFNPNSWQQNPQQQQWNQQQQTGYNQQQNQQWQGQQQWQGNPYQQPYIPPYNPFVHNTQTDLPNATNAQICGIVGIIMFWNIIGIALNIVALVMGNNMRKEYARFPGRYTDASLSRANTGRICGTIGLCLFGLTILIILLAVAANL